MNSPPKYQFTKRNFTFMPSLKRLALVKIASTLWNQCNVRDLFSEKFSEDDVHIDDTPLVDHRVIEKVDELLLPRILGKRLIYYIYRVRRQILYWIDFHIVQSGYVTLNELPTEFFWTPQGNIDNKKVAENLVQDERLEVYTRYKLACIYCLEECIKLLWKELPYNFYKNQPGLAIVVFWSYYVAGEIYQLCNQSKYKEEDGSWHTPTPFQYAFFISVATGNEAAIRYFLPKLTLDERKVIFSTTAFRVRYSIWNSCDKTIFSPCHYVNNLCYLLSELNEHEQTVLLIRYAAEVLDNFLRWPSHSFFLKSAKELWSFLSEEDYYNLLRTIAENFFSEAKIYNYQKLFGKFWQQGSADFKRYVIINHGIELLSIIFYEQGHKENIKLIFEAATAQEREEFILCPEGQVICRRLIEVGNWNLLTFFIQECTSSKEVFHKLKEKLGKIYLLATCDIPVNEESNILNEFNQLLYNVEHGNKWKCIDDEVSLTSKLPSSN